MSQKSKSFDIERWMSLYEQEGYVSNPYGFWESSN